MSKRRDGSLWMLVRAAYGIGESHSADRGKTWSEYGEPGHCGTAVYRKEFTFGGADAKSANDLHLDLGEVKYSAKVRLNGRDLGVRAWRPFRWAVEEAIKSGSNALEVEVTNTAANELAGSPQRLKEIENLGWLKNSYSLTPRRAFPTVSPNYEAGPIARGRESHRRREE